MHHHPAAPALLPEVHASRRLLVSLVIRGVLHVVIACSTASGPHDGGRLQAQPATARCCTRAALRAACCALPPRPQTHPARMHAAPPSATPAPSSSSPPPLSLPDSSSLDSSAPCRLLPCLQAAAAAGWQVSAWAAGAWRGGQPGRHHPAATPAVRLVRQMCGRNTHLPCPNCVSLSRAR